MKTKPKKREDELIELSFRITRGQNKTLRKMLIDDELYFQHLVGRFIEGYLAGEPLVMQMVNEWKEEEFDLSKAVEGERISFEKAERDRLLREIEQLNSEVK